MESTHNHRSIRCNPFGVGLQASTVIENLLGNKHQTFKSKTVRTVRGMKTDNNKRSISIIVS